MPDIFIPATKPEKPTVAPPPSTGRLHPFSSYCEMPEGVHFQNQDADETILLFLRRHFATNIPWIITTFILLLLPPLLVPLLGFSSFFSTLPGSYIFAILFFYYIVVLTYALIEYINWFYNISLVTEKRIVDIDYSNIVFHDVAMTKLTLVEDVNYTQSGFIRSFFDFGDVLVQTAAEMDHFDFLAVPKPNQVIKIIEELIGRRRNE